jgi:hypothetical protein
MTNQLIGNILNLTSVNPAVYFPGFMAKKDESVLSYRLVPTECAVTLQILSQSPQVKTFLNNGKSYFMASNGTRVAIDKFPEWKESKNIIFLRGMDSREDGKVDVTRFISNSNRDNKVELLTSALEEFSKAVKATQPKQTAYYSVDTFLSLLAGRNAVSFPTNMGQVIVL